MLYPLKLRPAFKDYIWGGSRLKTEFNKQTGLDTVAESWELSTHKDGESVVANGSYAGLTLSAALEKMGRAALGKAAGFDRFPILIKLIDARQKLSVQVHPGNEYAMRVEGEPGKTEMWYIVDAEPGASLIYGFKRDVTKQQLKAAIEGGTLTELLQSVPVKKGDVFFIPAGTVHAIGDGLLIAEIQQNSNTTYRVYDWGRKGADGKPRALHIDKALDVATLSKSEPPKMDFDTVCRGGYCETPLCECEYFKVSRLNINEKAALKAESESFLSLLFLEGSGDIVWGGGKIAFEKGDSFFIPASMGKFEIAGESLAIMTTI